MEEFQTAYDYTHSAVEKKQLIYKIHTAESLVGLESKVTPYMSDYFRIKKRQFFTENTCMVNKYDVDMIKDYEKFEANIRKKEALGIKA